MKGSRLGPSGVVGDTIAQELFKCAPELGDTWGSAAPTPRVAPLEATLRTIKTPSTLGEPPTPQRMPLEATLQRTQAAAAPGLRAAVEPTPESRRPKPEAPMLPLAGRRTPLRATAPALLQQASSAAAAAPAAGAPPRQVGFKESSRTDSAAVPPTPAQAPLEATLRAPAVAPTPKVAPREASRSRASEERGGAAVAKEEMSAQKDVMSAAPKPTLLGAARRPTAAAAAAAAGEKKGKAKAEAANSIPEVVTEDVELYDVLRGSCAGRGPPPEVRAKLWEKTLQWDLAIVLRNPAFWTDGAEGQRKAKDRGLSWKEASALFRGAMSGRGSSLLDEGAFRDAFERLPVVKPSCWCPCSDVRRALASEHVGKTELTEEEMTESPLAHPEGVADGCQDFLTLLRTILAAKLVHLGFTVSCVYSADHKHIYLLVAGCEGTLQTHAAKLRHPAPVDLEKADPEAFEPCDRSLRPLADAFRAKRDRAVTALLEALEAHEEAVGAENPAQRVFRAESLSSKMLGQGQIESSAQVGGVSHLKEAFVHYLNVRLKGRGAVRAIEEANSAYGLRDRMRCFWEHLGMPKPVEVLRMPYSLQQVPWRRSEDCNLAGKEVITTFSRTDRAHIMLGAADREFSILKLISAGYVADIIVLHEAQNDNAQPPEEQHIHSLFAGHLVRWSVGALTVGAALQAFCALAQGSQWQSFVSHAFVAYSAFLIFWATLCLGCWDNKQDHHLHCRGEVRSERRSSAASLAVPHRARRAASWIGTVLLALATFVPIYLVHGLDEHLFFGPASGAKVYNYSYNLVAVVDAVRIFVLNYLLRRAALGLTKLQSHADEAEFLDAYIAKAATMQLVNSYGGLLYAACAQAGLSGAAASDACTEDPTWWNSWGATCTMTRLNRQLGTVLLIFMLKIAILDVLSPLIAKCGAKLREGRSQSQVLPHVAAKASPLSACAGAPAAVDRALAKPVCGLPLGPEGGRSAPPDYSELVVLFGFMCLFGLCFAPAALPVLVSCALLRCSNRIRLGSWVRQQMPSMVTDMAAWRNVLGVLLWVSVVVNTVLLSEAARLDRHPAVTLIFGESAQGSRWPSLFVFGALLGAARLLAALAARRRPRALRLVEARLHLNLERLRAGAAAPPIDAALADRIAAAERGCKGGPRLDGVRSDFQVHTQEEWRELCAAAAPTPSAPPTRQRLAEKAVRR
mmetsp:Transcript_106830/g.341240  ORF Transcript_106830/g.341240 Transcript_106830/m.341240 type:complete len:1194 (+) Transcript_106830:69-3650(+)